MNTYLKRCRWGQFLLLRGDLISEYANLYGEWCEGEVELFHALLPEDGVVAEVGSNIGMHAVPISRFCGRGALFCYEPQRVIFQMLCANLALNERTNVFARHCAVGDTPGTVQVEAGDYEQPWNYGAFSVPAGYSAEGIYPGAVTQEAVPLIRLDDDMALAQRGRLDLLKVDAEGFEVQVLEGAAGLIGLHAPPIFVENNTAERFDAVLAALHAIGYACWWYCSSRCRESNFNRAFWPVPGRDVNMLCLPEGQAPPIPLVPVDGFADLDGGRLPLY